ncbi:MAG: amidohydrolase family protein [Candidatus Limivivens sp.]|nr:amidohydrolase family protein [Candidatus Limivivens sp.]
MKRIDAHLHFHNYQDFDEEARAVGHENTEEHLRKVFADLEIEKGIVMGNGGLDPASHQYPDFLDYCVGLDEHCLSRENRNQAVEAVENNLRRTSCVGIKIYAGYSCRYVSDDMYAPFYELAQTYGKPVAIHTGALAGSHGLLKYSHPLTVDEAAYRWPGVQFVLCHLGNPWLPDTMAVVEKNENVATDLSGLLEGPLEPEKFLKENADYVAYLRTWFQYLDDYDRILYGTDWPLVNLYDYLYLMEKLIPEKYWEKVFYENAKRIYYKEDLLLRKN